MSQHIGSQSGGVFYNAGRDQHIHGDHTATVNNLGVPEHVLLAARDLQAAIAQANLPINLRDQAEREARAVLKELDGGQPDEDRVAGALHRLTGVLVAAGPLASAAASLAPPLQTLAHWLGSAGQGLLQMLPMLH